MRKKKRRKKGREPERERDHNSYYLERGILPASLLSLLEREFLRVFLLLLF